ncbi:hypothetical protein ACFSJW_07110 [Flavobacterium artemisiae]|uniref:Uncharacterized protein n=1 Tax=Flavobacterium artemisiae TaxID=2126556 RepID=A0ABW4HCF3_9FLAO
MKEQTLIDFTDKTKWYSIGVNDIPWFISKIIYIEEILSTEGQCIVTIPKRMSNQNVNWLMKGISKEIDDFLARYIMYHVKKENHLTITSRNTVNFTIANQNF